MKLFIPALRTQLRLTEDWEFFQKAEHIDWTLSEYLYGTPPRWWDEQGNARQDIEMVRISSGTVLSVDRIYIRAGAKDYDSITFRIKKTKDKPGCRFWVPLDQANNIECEIVE